MAYPKTSGHGKLERRKLVSKKIKILKITRPYFGSFMMEGFNLIVWEII